MAEETNGSNTDKRHPGISKPSIPTGSSAELSPGSSSETDYDPVLDPTLSNVDSGMELHNLLMDIGDVSENELELVRIQQSHQPGGLAISVGFSPGTIPHSAAISSNGDQQHPGISGSSAEFGPGPSTSVSGLSSDTDHSLEPILLHPKEWEYLRSLFPETDEDGSTGTIPHSAAISSYPQDGFGMVAATTQSQPHMQQFSLDSSSRLMEPFSSGIGSQFETHWPTETAVSEPPPPPPASFGYPQDGFGTMAGPSSQFQPGQTTPLISHDPPPGSFLCRMMQLEPALKFRKFYQYDMIVVEMSKVDVPYDGYKWKRWAQHVLKGHTYTRMYFSCPVDGCNARKHVERFSTDPKWVMTTYVGNHSPDRPAPAAPNTPKKRPLTTT